MHLKTKQEELKNTLENRKNEISDQLNQLDSDQPQEVQETSIDSLIPEEEDNWQPDSSFGDQELTDLTPERPIITDEFADDLIPAGGGGRVNFSQAQDFITQARDLPRTELSDISNPIRSALTTEEQPSLFRNISQFMGGNGDEGIFNECQI